MQWRNNCPCRRCNAGGRGSTALVPTLQNFFHDIVVGYASSCLWTQHNRIVRSLGGKGLWPCLQPLQRPRICSYATRPFKVIRSGTIRKLWYGFLFAKYWWKIAIFSYPIALGAPVRGSQSGYCGTEKLEWWWCCPWWKKFDDTFSRFDRIPPCHGRTNRRTV